jgi:hypothetical protein
LKQLLIINFKRHEPHFVSEVIAEFFFNEKGIISTAAAPLSDNAHEII